MSTATAKVAASTWTRPPSVAPLAGLAALAQAIAAAPDLRSIYRALFAFAQAVGPTNGIFVALYDPERQLRTCVYGAGDEGEDDVGSLPPMPMNDSPQSRAIATGDPILTTDLQAALADLPVVILGGDADPRAPQSSLAVPMIVLGRTIGAFEVQTMESAAYGEEDIAAMVLAADIAALAIDRGRVLEPTGRAVTAIRRDLRRFIAEEAFAPVFQPIVELESRTTIGYEALTRFSDGTPPDVRFGQAHRVGLGLELEAATIEAAFRASGALPANGLLNLNVSPGLVLAGEPLGSMLREWGWQVVLELTEHVAVHDYDALRRAIRNLGPNVRLAVDDAGAGFASFRHILELAPHFVKLDRAIVGGIDADPARQAFVAGMHHFAVTTGCGLIAEGIETEAELQALRALGVSLGQGYLLGRPGPAASRPNGAAGSEAVGMGNRPTSRIG
ncbi:MAG TPA: EAL domain-containing protein [Patescibacteria group bacterium]|nr:EAL domain-containing protein [Patescibacteria group bacterium]